MTRPLRSLQVRHVDAGSCNACEQELTALTSRFYDMQQFGLDLVASPRHADAVIVTGPVTDTMRPALQKVFEAVPEPKWLIALGDCAAGCGVFQSAYASHGGVEFALNPPDIVIRGCPPHPDHILDRLRRIQKGKSPSDA